MKNIKILFLITLLLPVIANAQTWLWAKTGTNTSGAGSDHVTVNTNGNIYTLSSFTSSITIDGNTLNGSPQWGTSFIGEYSPNGVFLKNVLISKGNAQSGYSANTLKCDGIGNIYTVGQITGSTTFDTIQTNTYNQGYLAKFSSDLNCLNLKYVSDAVNSVSFDASNKAYVAGDVIKATSYIDTFTLHNTATNGVFPSNMFFASLNTGQQCLWAKQSYGGRGGGRCMVKNAFAYITGRMDTCVRYDTAYICPPTKTGTNFIFKTDLNGNVLKTFTYAMYGSAPQGISSFVDGLGNIYVFGTIDSAIVLKGQTIKCSPGTQQSAFLMKLDANFNTIWFREINTVGSITGRSITNDQGYTYILGNFSGTAMFGANIFTAQSNSDLYVARYNSNGDCMGAITVPGAKGYDIAEDAQGNAIVTGDIYTGTTNFGNIPLNVTGTQSFFLAKLSAISGGTPVQRIAEDDGLRIYPNPNSKAFTIDVPESLVQGNTARLGIYNSNGGVIKEEQVDITNNKVGVDIGTVQKGIYIVILSNGHKEFTGRVVVE